MRELGLYLGCVIPTEQYAYEMSIREVLPRFDIELTDLYGATCCGAPLRNINLFTTMYLSARNMALCEEKGIDLYAPCPICHLALTEAKKKLKENQELKEKINSKLKEEDLRYKGIIELYHTLDLLHDVIGLDEIEEKVEEPLEDITFAAHYGCNTIRPNNLDRPDDSENPQKLEELMELIGIETEDYPEKLDCCGGQVISDHNESALTKAGEKVEAVQNHGFDGMATICPWGQRMLDSKQDSSADTIGESLSLPVLYYIQLLGVAMGIDQSKLGLELNLSPVDKLEAIEGIEEVE
ncbi:MAG: CoB--CoM heterodisulfide reductase iron-sulfur subunit B family protein [Candidatus Thermoplasmatota archaeon]|nr:CoB--CoM heterodisulfide reductase iron-sulfur subunit B family protein [Candidatus Thermoplasmatota archaeon]MBS3817799.1 CoB--CoM heterodisulfide reductase iron-sulfur subunit B family protein [Candidatus Thermoplasmatota archaeon]